MASCQVVDFVNFVNFQYLQLLSCPETPSPKQNKNKRLKRFEKKLESSRDGRYCICKITRGIDCRLSLSVVSGSKNKKQQPNRQTSVLRILYFSISY